MIGFATIEAGDIDRAWFLLTIEAASFDVEAACFEIEASCFDFGKNGASIEVADIDRSNRDGF